MKHCTGLLATLIVIGMVAGFGNGLLYAETFCVDTAAELDSALTTAVSNGEDDLIRIVQGEYTGNFVYGSTEAFDVTIEGGYTSGCTGREVNAINTILDGTDTDTVLVLSSLQVVDFSVDGVALFNGAAQTIAPSGGTEGGGLNASTEGSLTVTNCIVRGSTAGNGGGILGEAGSLITLSNNIISDNSAFYGGGACVYGDASTTITLSGNIIINNQTTEDNSGYGGGVAVGRAGACNINGNTIRNNTANNNVSGFISGGAWLSGGGVYVEEVSTAIVSGNTISGNTGRSGGGGIAVSATAAIQMTNNVVIDNVADSGIEDGGGGGVYLFTHDGSIIATNNTITGNTAGSDGGGLRIGLRENSAEADIHNNIIWNNSASDSSDLYINNDGNGDFIASTVDMLTNDFDQGVGGFDSVRPIAIDASNLDNVDPLFIDTANGAYYLNQSSTLIDLGTNGAAGVPAVDKDGNARPSGSNVELGAYEYMNTSADIAIVPVIHTFGQVEVGSSETSSIRVYNAGGAVLNVGNVAQANALAAPFSISNDGCSGDALAHAESCVLEIGFTPTALNYFGDSFDVPSNDPNSSSVTVTVHGVGDTASSSNGGDSGGGGGGGCFISSLI
jgi:parallel beta-helix repeat protein